MNRIIWRGWFTLLCILTLLLPSQLWAAEAQVSVGAQGAALIDVTSGRILYSKQGDKPLRIASLTKVMTAIVAIEHGKLSDEVKVNTRAAGKEGSSLYLRAGDTMSLTNLLYGLMLRSGNDGATAIAEHVGGSVEGFVYLMNEKAKLLGMEHTTFSNPTGLDEGQGNFASANDMAKLTAYALKNTTFQEIVRTKVKRVPNPNETWDYVWTNKNKMLFLYEGADGVKTGYTKLAKRCLISSATKGNQQLAVVTLNDSDDWVDHTKLLNYGFEQYPLQIVTQQGEQKGEEGWVAGQSFLYPLSANEQGKIVEQVVANSDQSLEDRLGVKGELYFSLKGQTIGSVKLYEENTNKHVSTSSQQSWSNRLLNAINKSLSSLFEVTGS
ncbi:D-alanyl-D-alanine carboxypeptidase [Paenibacillus albiflavus]|uniref:D-alanyl-D-alanine carboxypeptidase n=1 Tax=Paenibacillus albiflavus TaxID=2545760 RepID=A0A4R4ELU8_9BACL|nr:D-alanyl-D-alanine carboxypeptidase family protein [Paenibacillus albiflavus]TCZ81256.1 D-alanyl-D-alanine carboxypeptidase [Paenibacillus albiflavus]